MIRRTWRIPLLLFMVWLAACASAAAQANKERPRPARSPRTFELMDFKKRFTAGPLSDPRPPSTLLAAGATSVALRLKAEPPTVCRYSVNRDVPFDQMTPFDEQQPSAAPHTEIRGLDADPSRLNEVFIRSAATPDAVLHLEYRSLPAANHGFPRTANLWGVWNFLDRGQEQARKIDLWLGVRLRPDQVRNLRRLNPRCLVLTDINTVENNDVPDAYFLRDTTGRKIEVWPGAFRLNLTRPEVAEYQAHYAYQRMLESKLSYDGCFFDNFMMSQSWLKTDIYDRPVQLDGDGDGKPDPLDAFDKAWRAGIFHELRTWRTLMPWALTTGHSQGFPHPEIAEIFNGQGIGFDTTDVIEGKKPFHQLWDYYNAWCTVTVKPAITSVESAVPDQIAYGYDYQPERHMPRSTWNFARDYYPYMRFGLAFTMMNDGYFSHELGDTEHGQNWWYDELDFKLGEPLGPARAVEVSAGSRRELITDGGFETELGDSWRLWSDESSGCRATVSRDADVKHSGAAAARITVEAAGSEGGVEFIQPARKITKDRNYTLSFWARADQPMEITCHSSKSSPKWDDYGLDQDVRLTTSWKSYTITFTAARTAGDARIQFLCGNQTGTFWIDDVALTERADEIYRRDFTSGIVLLNGTTRRHTLRLDADFARLKGSQAAKHQYILDDGKVAGFRATGAWKEQTLGTKDWHAIPPYYHAWNNRCHLLTSGAGEASWNLDLRGPGTYTIQAWWAAAPQAKDWTKRAVYEVVADGKVVVSVTLDQTAAGDEWHSLCPGLKLAPEQKPFVRLRNGGSGTLVADALHVFSAERYNDGSVVREVTLEPMDGIVLQRTGPASTAKPRAPQ